MCDESPENNNDNMIYDILNDYNPASGCKQTKYNFKSPTKKEKPQ